MRERLIELMQMLNLTPTQFATSIGVQRATLQHIINGRNEPSLKIILAVHAAFPQIDTEWLLSGKGNPFGDSELPQSNPADYPLFPGMENVIFPDTGRDNPGFQNVREETKPSVARKKPYNKEVKKEIESISAIGGKNIKEVIIFFEDGTYQKFSQ